MAGVPSSKNRRRVEIPVGHYDRLKQIADAEGRTITSVLDELLGSGLRGYEPLWLPGAAPGGEAYRLSDTLTECARQVLERSRSDAPTQFNHNYSGTEHFLLALVQEPEGVGGRVLREAGVKAKEVGGAIEFIIGRGDKLIPGVRRFTPRALKVLALALDEARQLGHEEVGTGHLLLGLIREGEGIAVGIWESLGADGKALRAATLAAVQSEGWKAEEALTRRVPEASQRHRLEGMARRVRESNARRAQPG